ncbi:helix-turn-helix domain-containing protein [Rhizobium sp. 32-5/1]|uniref:helix-turn-helix domain-containing protein n=1 Tax=Rhizobium sp. 32-5/1 TaxID=3019602 RepID=UPI00240E08AE|nr:helix-turn-helix domain-containing protein [Rhizobium sp. 32-5/1]WEZ82192.1 helix-turn-helix domain-containing protein [Rhizobium sp. 32-5/1]
MPEEFLTEPEVAKLLRCSTSKVKRLRLAGKLDHVPGRPVLISSADLKAYLDSIKVHALPGDGAEPPRSAAAAGEAAESARVAFAKYKAREALKAGCKR